MNLREGDSVIHWAYGLGTIIRQEERTLSGNQVTYYMVQVGDITVWVPADDMLENRLRLPTSRDEFNKVLAIFSEPTEALPEDRHERKLLLIEMLKDGHAEALCRIIHGLTLFHKKHSLNDNDQIILKRAKNTLFGEWGFALSITPAQAEVNLYRLLADELPSAG